MTTEQLKQKTVSYMTTHKRKIKWSLAVLICFVAFLWAIHGWDMVGYAQSWLGSLFKALSGAFIGWVTSRYILDLDLSEIKEELRPMAALSQAIIMAAFIIAGALGA